MLSKNLAMIYLFAVSLLAIGAMSAQADILRLERVVTAPEKSTSFGWSIALQGSQALVSRGFENDRYGMEQELFLMDLHSGEIDRTLNDGPAYHRLNLNAGIDMDASRALVCGSAKAIGEETDSARLFDRSSGALLTRFHHSDPKAERINSSDRFGHRCRLHGDLVIITASHTKGYFDNSKGLVYIFSATTGALIRRILPHDPVEKTKFGTDVATNGKVLAISSTGATVKRGYFGYVDLYDLKSGAHLRRIERPANFIPYNSGRFGYRLAMQDKYLVIGNIRDTLKTGRKTGSVWVYDLTDYSLSHMLTPPYERSYTGLFGLSFSIWDDLILVGGSDSNGRSNETGKRLKEAGKAFLFDINTGALLQEFENPTPHPGDKFGRAVSLGPRGALISASNARTGTDVRGEIYIYEFANDL